MTETDPLLAAVEALTKPATTGVAQKNEKTGRWERVHEVTHDPLLKQMRDRVWPSGENNGGTAAAPQERVPLDAHMLYEYAKIATQISSWVTSYGIRSTRDACRDLQAWYAATRAIHGLDEDWYTLRLRGWARHITKLLAKTGSFTIEAPCPICGTTAWGNAIDGGGIYPIKVEYVIDDNEHLTDHSAICQHCKAVWDGWDAVDELREELLERRG